jgi:hypothetical protein
LLSEMQGAYQAQFCDPRGDLDQILGDQFLKTVKRRPKSFPYLAVGFASWKGFFKEQPTILRLHLVGVRLRPASLFDLWLSWCKGVDTEWLRQTGFSRSPCLRSSPTSRSASNTPKRTFLGER